ncbi:hypothetical protein N8766_04460 [bacterium]|jgi:hypothetical protein|nr:hypothetical protein [Verrucomicrobiota bacterium]MDA7633341.1 hypothetical protein [bacterium]MDA7657666.1 hypothetical protein [Verrucomicrobiota bacterium]MDB4796852.1 hypothetical protein [bacterium]MDB4798385.1 hypothetical protein [Verrucomicrobiota bacterium]
MSPSAGQNTLITLLTLFVLGGILTDVTLKLGGDIPALPRLTTQSRPNVDSTFDKRIETLFEPQSSNDFLESKPDQSPFFTHYFKTPPKPPPPKKAQTRKFKITFQGFYTTSTEDQKAFIMVDDQFKSVRVGEKVVEDLFLLSLERSKIEIGPEIGAPKSIGFRQTSTIEIPE